MSDMPPDLQSKMPKVGDSVFSVMSALARREKAINLAQGFPDFDGDPQLIDLAYDFMKQGHNQYAPMKGIHSLRQILSEKINALYQTDLEADQITITNGATQALYTAIAAFVRQDDEVIVIEPAYDSYAAAVMSCQGKVIPVQMALPEGTINLEEIRQRITPKTRMIILNSPHNPSGQVIYTDDFFDQLADIVVGTDIIVLSDEVYEHLVYDGISHQSMLKSKRLRSHTLSTFSFGKTFHFTGWKMGYIAGDQRLMEEFRKHHQYTVFSVNHPLQHALAEYLKAPENYLGLSDFFQKKRDFFADGLQTTRFKWLGAEGTYFGLVDYSDISDLDDVAFAQMLTEKHKVAAIPLSPFYSEAPEQRLLRLCFAKKEETMRDALERLQKV